MNESTLPNGWIDTVDKLPPACHTVLVVRKDTSRKNAPPIVESYYVSTHPRECVHDDGIIAWRWYHRMATVARMGE